MGPIFVGAKTVINTLEEEAVQFLEALTPLINAEPDVNDQHF
jgi:hypothetical protein